MLTTELTFTPEQLDVLASLPEPVQQTLQEYPSVAENWLMAQQFPPLPKGYQWDTFEVYYDCHRAPHLHIENGVSVTTPQPLSQPPRIIEIMDATTFVFIQVEGHVLLDRLNGNQPPHIHSIQVEV